MLSIEYFPLSRPCFRTAAQISRSQKLARKKFGHRTARVLWTPSAYLAFLYVFGPPVLCSRAARVKQPRILCEGAARISSTLITTHFFPEINERASRKTVYYPICLYYDVKVFLVIVHKASVSIFFFETPSNLRSLF